MCDAEVMPEDFQLLEEKLEGSIAATILSWEIKTKKIAFGQLGSV